MNGCYFLRQHERVSLCRNVEVWVGVMYFIRRVVTALSSPPCILFPYVLYLKVTLFCIDNEGYKTILLADFKHT